jgi:hypothetical protein
MHHEAPLIVPHHAIQNDVHAVPGEDHEPRPAPSPEQEQAVDAVFAERQEHDTIYPLLGLWTSAVLLGDLTRAHLEHKDELEEEEEEPREER